MIQNNFVGPVVFLKLGGSLITDKTQIELVRKDVLARLAKEIARSVQNNPDLNVLLGHGSGSFGHVPAARHGTREGVRSNLDWHGFVEVGRVASKLNAIVRNQLVAEGLKAISLQPSASAICRDGGLIQFNMEPVLMALSARLIPIIYGDIAFDTQRGGTIISTEEIMSFLSDKLQPSWLLLAGETAGVYDVKGKIIPIISPENFETIRPALGGSRGTDVTGGMATKVESMLELVKRQPNLQIRVFSGLVPDSVEKGLAGESTVGGTLIRGLPV